MPINLETIKQLQIRGELKKALKYSLSLAEATEDDSLSNDGILLSARFHSNEKAYKQGLLAQADYNVESARIRASLQSLVDEMKDDYPNIQIEGEENSEEPIITNIPTNSEANMNIQRAIEELNKANIAGYFEIMDNLSPASTEYQLNQLKGIFMSGKAPWDFNQQLQTFAKLVEKELKNSTSTNSEDSTLGDTPDSHHPKNTAYTSSPTKDFSSNLPASFIQELQKQIEEQYQIILRYRKLRNDAIDSNRRSEYKDEIRLREDNIEEIEDDYLRKAKRNNPEKAENELKNEFNELKEFITQKLDFMSQDLKSSMKELDLGISGQRIVELSQQIEIFKAENKEELLELAHLVLDVSDQHTNTDQNIKKLQGLIATVRKTDDIEAKLKLSLPLFEYLGIAKIEAEVSGDLKGLAQKFWQKMKRQ